MKKLAVLVITALLLSSCARDFVKSSKNRIIEKFPGLAAQEYVTGIEDMPVYHGFEEKAGSSISYDTTDGRIINAEFYSNDAKPSEVKLFYEATLPQLGWRILDNKTYERDGEILELGITEKDGKTALKFKIKPSIS